MKLVWVVLSFLLSNFAWSEVIELKDSVQVEPKVQLTLFDLVDEKSKSQALEIKKQLQQALLVQAPKIGERIELSFKTVVEHLKLVLSTEQRSQYKFSIPRKIEVSVESPELTEKFVINKLSKEWSQLCHPCEVRVSDIRLPLGRFSRWEIKTPTQLPKGSFNIPMTSISSEGQESRYWIQGKVDVLKEVPVAERALYVGERVQESDFKYKKQVVTFANDGVPSKELIVGLQVKVPVSANSVIWSRNLAREKAVKRGDQVRVFSSSGLWEMSVSAVAEKDAEVGDLLTLRNPTTKKNLTGLVVGKGEVRVR